MPLPAYTPSGRIRSVRDILARTIYGGQISLMIGLVAMVVEVIMGVLIGAVAGYYGGITRQPPDALYRSHVQYPADPPAAGAWEITGRQGANHSTCLGREFSGSVIVIIAVIGFDQLDAVWHGWCAPISCP